MTHQILIVGEAPSPDEERLGTPFSGQSGMELTRLLMEAGINRHECFLTNVVSRCPPGGDIEGFFHTKKEARLLGQEPWRGRYPKQEIIEGIKPEIIIALGNTPLWALTGHSGIMSWRGSWLEHSAIPLLPTLHPSAILRDWSTRFLVLKDLQRVGRALREGVPTRPAWDFAIRPTFDNVIAHLSGLISDCNHCEGPLRFATDIETRGGQIACVGIAWSSREALCIPFMCIGGSGSYWSAEEELQIILALRTLLTHPNARHTFHNGAYDCQYFAHQWGFAPARIDDTMIMQHVAFSGLRKSLAMCSSLYCHWHRYWKDDGKTWENENEEQLWTYNCEDCVRTWEVREALERALAFQGQEAQYEFQIGELWPQVFKAMLRGTRIDFARRAEMDHQLEVLMREREEWFVAVLGHRLNPRSYVQMPALFYTDFGCAPVINRKTKRITCDDDALTKIKAKSPLLANLCDAIADYRSCGVFLSTFVRAEVPPDGRMRCTYNLAGTETFRFSSSEDAFGFGTNLQNIPRGDE